MNTDFVYDPSLPGFPDRAHEIYRRLRDDHPIYHNEEVQRVILNAVRWARPTGFVDAAECVNVERPREDLG